jgi:4'-phosphopantetheinyl transferase
MLGSDEVHVWRASLDLEASCVQSLLSTLSEEERVRAERFCFQKDREHFIVARGLLRAILGRYLDMQPSQLRFCYSPYGKPTLTRESGGDMLQFNLSHSHRLALVAVTRGREIGVDLEYIRPEPDLISLAERFFSPREVAVLCALPANMQTEAFFNCWTRKEAYLKAKGFGLSIPLSQFDVSLAPGEPAALLSTNWDTQEASRWSLRELNPGPGYVAALTVLGHHWWLFCWQWPG